MPKDEFLQSAWPMLRVADLYYNDNKSLSEISKITHLSMSTLTRMLRRARSTGVVSINIAKSMIRCLEMAAAITKEYGLRFCIVTPLSYYGIKPEDSVQRMDNLALEGARYLQHILQDGDTLGIGCNHMMRKMANYLNPCWKVDGHFVLLSGMLKMQNDDRDVGHILEKFRKSIGVNTSYPITKGFASDTEQLLTWMKHPMAKKYIKSFGDVTISMVNCQPIFLNDGPVPILSENLSRQELDELKNKGAIGEFLLRFYTEQGVEPDTAISRRTFGITLDQYRKIPTKIVLSARETGSLALKAVLQNDLADILITDEYGAEALLSNT